MPALRNAGKNLARLREISATVVRHGFGQVFDRARIFEAIGLQKPPETPVPTRSAAVRFRDMLGELGPTFVKLGQVLSSRPDLLPPDFVRELSTLQDNVPALGADHVRKAIEQGLGRPVSELFASLDPEPLASASIAQVHGARTLSGDEVVVKVQRPNIAEGIRADLDLLYYVASFLERVVEETGIYTPTGIVEEFERSLKGELDFTREAANVELFLKNNVGREHVVIPRVYRELTCTTVLTLQRLRGTKITNLDPAVHDAKQVARNLVDIAFEHAFVDGVFHGDPHPGNLFVIDGSKVGMVDFGLVGRMTKSMQETLIVLCLGIALRDADTAVRIVYKVGVPDERVSLAKFRTDVAELFDRYLGLELKEIQSASLIDDLLSLALRYKIKVPKEYAILTKSLVTIEGVLRKLDPDLDIAAIALPYAKRVLLERVTPTNASSTALRMLLKLQGAIDDVPLQLSQVLLDLEGGKFVTNVRAPELPQLVAAVRWLGVVVFAGLLSAALIVGAFILLASRTDWLWNGIPVLALVALFLAASLFGGAVGTTLLAGRLQKISVRKWLGRE